MISLNPGMVDTVFSLGSAAAGETVQGTAGTTFAVSPILRDSQENEVVVEYTEQTAPATVGIDIEAGNAVDASGDLVAPIEVLATINTLGNKSVRQKIGRYRFVRLNLTAMAGASAEVTGKIGM
ncbi:hypothetical protein LCGC14_2432180 [marine sediment metagenome]|uniref:Uncharacterized protein n=1 Tax=marine sediment metagenome TaxID=412755 RepID=A0A0F9C902_9ZZZZ